MVRQVDEVVGSFRDTRNGDLRRVDLRPGVPIGAAPRATPSRIARSDGPPDDRPPIFSPPILVLVAALAIFEGYHWLHLMPSESGLPTEVLFLVGVVPVTTALTRHLRGSVPRALCLTARAISVALVALGLVEATVGGMLVTRALGLSSLMLAGVLLTLTAVVETAERRRTRHL